MQGKLSEPIFYGDLVYKFKRIVGKPNFSDQFKKIVKRYIRVGYNLDIMRQSACLVLNPITVYSYGFLFNCTTVGQASDSMTALTSLIGVLGPDAYLLLDPPWLSLGFSLALAVCGSWALFFVSSWCVGLVGVFLHDGILC